MYTVITLHYKLGTFFFFIILSVIEFFNSNMNDKYLMKANVEYFYIFFIGTTNKNNRYEIAI